MTTKQAKNSLGMVVEWEGKLWFLLDVVREKGGWNNRLRTWVVIGARGKEFTVPPQSIKLAADYHVQRKQDASQRSLL